jgi:hypothetical protein
MPAIIWMLELAVGFVACQFSLTEALTPELVLSAIRRLSESHQAALLRKLEDGEISRWGTRVCRFKSYCGPLLNCLTVVLHILVLVTAARRTVLMPGIDVISKGHINACKAE